MKLRKEEEKAKKLQAAKTAAESQEAMLALDARVLAGDTLTASEHATWYYWCAPPHATSSSSSAGKRRKRKNRQRRWTRRSLLSCSSYDVSNISLFTSEISSTLSLAVLFRVMVSPEMYRQYLFRSPVDTVHTSVVGGLVLLHRFSTCQRTSISLLLASSPEEHRKFWLDWEMTLGKCRLLALGIWRIFYGPLVFAATCPVSALPEELWKIRFFELFLYAAPCRVRQWTHVHVSDTAG